MNSMDEVSIHRLLNRRISNEEEVAEENKEEG